MSINYAILGILSNKPLTGYDLKKIIQESPFMYWSGNNNQIYKSLVELLEEGLVTNEIHHQESSPSKKIYTITKEGLEELKNWVLTSPEPPEFKKMFLVQLAWSNQLSTEELSTLISGYENEIRMQMLLQQEKKRRQIFSPDRNPREVLVWNLIYENIISSYENELNWIQKVRKEVCSNLKEETNRMNYKVIEKNNEKYIECVSTEKQICTEQDALDIVAACWENNAYHLMLHDEVICDDFFNLRTGLAGNVMQKFVNYNIKAAVVITSEHRIKGKFKEMISEANKGNVFRSFKNVGEAENWLLNLS
jgi:PadR family transcriptional regulator, regulatory protein AphA